MTLTVRSASVTGATTKGSALTHAEMDANWAHVIQSSNQSFVPSGTGAIARTVQAKEREILSITDYYANGVSGVAVDPTFATDSYLGIQAVIDYAYNSAISDVYVPPGRFKTSKPLYLWGATHYWTTGATTGGVTLRGAGKNASVIEKNTNTAIGDGSSYTNDDAVILIAAKSKVTTDAAYNAQIKGIYVKGTGGASKCAWAVYMRGTGAHLKIEDSVLDAKTCFQATGNMWLSKFSGLDLAAVNYGFRMDASGTSNLLENIFCTGADTIAYTLRGEYSTGNSLACDSCTGICYSFNFAQWVVNGLGSESTGATVVVQTAGPSYVELNGISILPQNNVVAVVFNITGADTVIVNGGKVATASPPTALAGKFAAVASAASTFIKNNLYVGDTYAVADTGPSMVSAGGTKIGVVSVPTATATALYTLTGHEVGFFTAYLGDAGVGNGSIFAVAFIGQAGGNPGFGAIVNASLTLTLVAGVIKVQHALGSTVNVWYKFTRQGESTT